MALDLAALFRDGTRKPSDRPLGFRVGGTWYCPACGVVLTEDQPGDLRCQRCGRALNELVTRLVEQHSHTRRAGENEASMMPFALDEAARVAHAWLEIQRNWWAHGTLDELIQHDPAGAFAALEAMIGQADSDELLGDIGAGPLEDFVRAHGEAFLERLEARAAEDGQWREAFTSVWLPDGDDPLTARLERLGCVQLRAHDSSRTERRATPGASATLAPILRVSRFSTCTRGAA